VVVQNGLFRTPAVIKEKLIGYLVSREVAKDPVASMLKQKINNIIAAAYERGENYYQGPITCFPEFNSLRDKYNHICLNLRKVVEPEVKKQMASELRKHAPRKDTATAIDKAIELLHERMDILKNELRGIEQLQSMKKRPRVMTHAEYVAKKQDYSICELEKTSANRGLQKLSMGLDVVAIVAAGLFIKYMYSRLRLNRPKNTK
jgi:hypothetical protein